MLGNSVVGTSKRVLGALFIGLALSGAALAQQPLKIGFGMSLTGPLAGNGKAALISMQIWAEDVNAKGGLLGRKVELVYYDDQTNPSTVPGLYSKLLDVDKVDLVVSGYGTAVIAPAMPLMMQRNMAFMTLFGLNVEEECARCRLRRREEHAGQFNRIIRRNDARFKQSLQARRLDLFAFL